MNKPLRPAIPSNLRYMLSLLLALSLLLPLSPGKSSHASQAQTAGVALVRIAIDTPEQLRDLADQQRVILARLYTPSGETYLLALADSQLQETLASQGYRLRVLDSDIQDKTYYLLYALPEDLERARNLVTILEQEGRQAVAALTPDQVLSLNALGIQLMPLNPKPLVAPEPAITMALPSLSTPHPLVQEIISKLTTDTIFYYNGSLSGEWSVTINDSPYTIATRYTYTDVPIKKATRYAYDYLQSLGLSVDFDTYYLSGVEKRNVIAQQPGVTQPERIYLLTAHLDSISNAPYSLAPGSDDNASGSAALMAIAEILRHYQFGCTLRYALFTGEEQGNVGSQDYAADVYLAGEKLEGVLNLDMLAYNTPGSPATIELHTRKGHQGDLSIANLFADTISIYGISLNPLVLQDAKSFSDHASFWDYGYSAIMAIEDWTDHTPYYHKTGDQLETLNLNYYTEFSKAALATFAHMGCLLSGSLDGRITNASNGNPIPNAYIEAQSATGNTQKVYSQPDGTYHLVLGPGTYTISSAAPNFQLFTIQNVIIQHDQSTVRDFQLQPSPEGLTFYLPVAAQSGY